MLCSELLSDISAVPCIYYYITYFYVKSSSLTLFVTDMVAVVTQILRMDMSINLYMFHGGTNFGFMNGAFAIGTPAPKAMITSYGMYAH